MLLSSALSTTAAEGLVEKLSYLLQIQITEDSFTWGQQEELSLAFNLQILLGPFLVI